MAFIAPNSNKTFERDPDEGNIPTGMYLCELTRVGDAPPSAKFPNGNPRIVFEFTVRNNPQLELNGRNAIVFLGKTLLKSKEGRESNLVKWARMMGVPAPEAGFDPDTLVGKMFNVMIEYTPGTGDQPGRAWARQAMAAGATVAQPVAAPATTAPAKLWDISDGVTVQRGVSTADVQALIDANPKAFETLKVKPAGAPNTEAKTPKEYGFSDVVPF